MLYEQRIKDDIKNSLNEFADYAEAGLKEDDGTAVSWVGTVYGTENVYRLTFIHISGDPAGVRTIMLRLYRKGTDREYSQFDFKGTLAELINYIRTPLYNLDNYYERIMKMSAKCDDYWEENG
ncbi:MAG: hypothetical protein IK086_03870 [Clostridia bacterium]|nr:hypothetical protein [Clostridia bacterium]